MGLCNGTAVLGTWQAQGDITVVNFLRKRFDKTEAVIYREVLTFKIDVLNSVCLLICLNDNHIFCSVTCGFYFIKIFV